MCISAQINEKIIFYSSLDMGLIARKPGPAFVIFDKASFKPVSSATETCHKIEISPVPSLHIIISKKQITKALISLRGCASWSAPVLFANLRRQVFLRCGPYIRTFLYQSAYGPRREKTCLQGFANNKGEDQPAHPRNLISAFVIP